METATETSIPRREDVVTAYDPANKSWVTGGQAGPASEKLPALEGTLHVSAPALREAASDFGHVVSRQPSAILRPGTAEDIARMIRFARKHGLKIGPRGMAHTMYGHTHVEAGIVIDMSSLTAIHSLGEDQVEVDAGLLWSTLVARTIAVGRAPPVITDYLDLSVGGTLSVGGVSGATYKYGVQLDNVLQLQVVTGEGERVSCSATQNRELFEAVLAGLGQCGVIVRATLRLTPAPASTRVYDLFYADLGTLHRDTMRLVADGRFDYLHGFILPNERGEWMYGLRCLAYYNPPERPDDARLLEGLSYLRGGEQISDQKYLEFLNRMVPQVAELKRVGRWTAPHPWCDLLVPASRLEALLGQALQEVAPAEISHYFPILMYPFKREHITRPLFRVPEEDTFFLLDILRTAGPGTRSGAEMVAHNRTLFERNRAVGGTHYSISAIERSLEDWKQHFGPTWEGFVAAKRRYDPDQVLTPGPGIFR